MLKCVTFLPLTFFTSNMFASDIFISDIITSNIFTSAIFTPRHKICHCNVDLFQNMMLKAINLSNCQCNCELSDKLMTCEVCFVFQNLK